MIVSNIDISKGIKTFNQWANLLPNTWMIKTKESIDEVNNHFRWTYDLKTKLIIAEVHKENLKWRLLGSIRRRINKDKTICDMCDKGFDLWMFDGNKYVCVKCSWDSKVSS